ncbi:IS30 family transposase [Anatilimnocola sp. NA78]|uniref:IS30 family transposase n=1 Tax=Anatilimnocola sp. NA78 TaxID=3415683 RepID=UPI003CE5289C
MEERQTYRHFTLVERQVLAQLVAMRATQQEMASCLGRDVRTIRAELKRNSRYGGYSACEAQRLSEQRRCQARQKCRKLRRPELVAVVTAGLRKRWSPDQIAGRLKRQFPCEPQRRCSSQTIYRWIDTDDFGYLWRRMLRNHKRRKPRARQVKSPAREIAGRPEIINLRERIGDWEGDTIVGRGGRASLVSLVERKTGFALLLPVENRCAPTVNNAIKRRLGTLPPEARHSLTFDNGSEFAGYQELMSSLSLDIYFATPRCPWQRGSNEHFNRLVREFFPKGTDLRGLNRRKLAEVQRLLNQRPRKRLNYQTPDEIFSEFCQRTLLT